MTIVYFDSSAFIKLLVDEDGSDLAALLWDGCDAIFHFNGLGTDATWDQLALLIRASADNRASWSKAPLVQSGHELRTASGQLRSQLH